MKWKRENERHLIRKNGATHLTYISAEYIRAWCGNVAIVRGIQSRAVSGTSVVIYGMLIATLRYVPHLSGNCHGNVRQNWFWFKARVEI
jgi:hypothetical protein